MVHIRNMGICGKKYIIGKKFTILAAIYATSLYEMDLYGHRNFLSPNLPSSTLPAV